jgi:uncharacterized protein (TIGR00725 family)
MGTGRSRRHRVGARRGRVSSGGPAKPAYRVAVIGAGEADEAARSQARALGAALAAAGAIVVCGGRGGVMESVARGALEAGGLTVGILPGTDAAEANPWIAVPLPTGMGEARNALVVRAAEAVLAVGGEWGTLSEIALARKMRIPVATLGAPWVPGLGLLELPDPPAAAAWALERASEGRKPRSEPRSGSVGTSR